MKSVMLFIDTMGILLSILFTVLLGVFAFKCIEKEYMEAGVTCFVGSLISILAMFELIVFMGGIL